MRNKLPNFSSARVFTRRTVSGCFIFAMLLCAANGCTTTRHASPSDSIASSFGSQQAAPPFTQVDAQRISTALTAGTPDSIAAVVSSEFPPSGYAQPILPPGATISIDLTTFKLVDGGTNATVLATVTGPQPGRWTLVLIPEAGAWRVLDSEPSP